MPARWPPRKASREAAGARTRRTAMSTWIRLFAVASMFIVVLLSGETSTVLAKPTEKTSFGKTPDGQNVDLYTLANKNGMQVAITNFGGIVVRIKTADRQGKTDDVVLGYDSLDGYVNDAAYFGAVIGRYGWAVSRTDAHQQGRRGRLPGKLIRQGGVHADGPQRIEDRLQRHDRQKNGSQSDESLLFQSEPWRQRRPATCADDSGGQIYPGGCGADPYRRVAKRC